MHRRRNALITAAVLAAVPLAGTQTARAATDVTTVTGRAVTVVVDDAHDHGPLRTRTFVEVDRRLLDVPDQEATAVAGARTGERVRLTVTGLRSTHAPRVVAARRTGVAPAAAGVVGTHTVTVLPVYWSSPDGQTQSSLTTLADQLSSYWGEQSAGAVDVRTSVRDWRQVSDPGSCNPTTLWNAALSAHGVAQPSNPNTHVLVYFPYRADCGGWAGLGSVGGSQIWVNGYPLSDVVAHELGHNLGLGHANSATCTGATGRVPLSDSCTVAAYQDSADVMGYATYSATGNLNSAFADYLGLATTTQATTGTTTTATLAPLAQVTAHRAVKIPVSNGTVYVDYRPATGRDVRRSAWAGVQVHLRTNTYPPTSQLLDLQPWQPSAFTSTSLPTWAVWPVPGTGLSVKVTNVTATGATVSVVPTLGDTAKPPVVTPSAPAAGQTVRPGSTLSWPASTDAGSGTAAYAVLVDGALVSRVGPTATSFTLPTLASGSHTLRVDATDNAGNTATGAAVGFTVSTTAAATAPRLLAPTTGGWTGSTATVGWAVDVPTAAAVVVDDAVAVSVPSGTTTVTVADLADGPHRFAVRALDVAGATTATSATVTATTDGTAPMPATGLTVTGSTLRWTAATDATSGIASYRLTVDGVTLPALAGPATSAGLSLLDGSHTASLVATDRAGNAAAPATLAFVKDTSAPSPVTITSPTTGAVLTSRTATLSWDAAVDAQSGIRGYRVTATGRQTPLLVEGTATSAALTLPEGRAMLTVAAVNGAGLAGPATTVQVVTDTLDPAVPTKLLAAADGSRLSWSASPDGGTPVTFAVSVDGAEPITSTTTSLTLALTPGRHEFAVRAVDAAGHRSAAATLVRWLDTTGPAATTLLTPSDGAFLAARSATVTWSAAQDDESGVVGYKVWVNGAPKNVPLDADARSVTVPVPEGRSTVTVAALNQAGLLGAQATRTVVVDSLAPRTPTRLAAPVDGSSLSWTATADTGSAVRFRVGLDGAEPVDVAAAPWSTTTAPGRHTWIVTAVDAAGNASAPATLTAWVDGTAPSAPAMLLPASGAVTASRSLLVSWAPSVDDDTGVAGYRVSVNGRPVGTLGAQVSTALVTVPEGSVTVSVVAVNPAGGVSPAGTVSLVVDSLRPNPPTGVTVSAQDVVGWTGSADVGTAPTGVVGYLLLMDGVEQARAAATDPTTASVTTPAGRHVWTVRALDGAGNLSSAAMVTVSR